MDEATLKIGLIDCSQSEYLLVYFIANVIFNVFLILLAFAGQVVCHSCKSGSDNAGPVSFFRIKDRKLHIWN